MVAETRAAWARCELAVLSPGHDAGDTTAPTS
jgi:hypothetical protein